VIKELEFNLQAYCLGKRVKIKPRSLSSQGALIFFIVSRYSSNNTKYATPALTGIGYIQNKYDGNIPHFLLRIKKLHCT
jgi:hypothetical protein